MIPGNLDISGVRRDADLERCQNCKSGILMPVRDKPGWRECKTCGNRARDDKRQGTAPSFPGSEAKIPKVTVAQIKMQRSVIEERLQSVKAGDVCPHCGKAKIMASEGGELDCQLCGFVVSQSGVDQGPEWRSFPGDGKEDTARTGPPSSITRIKSTKIGKHNVDSSGQALSREMKLTIERLRTWDSRTNASLMDRNLGQAFRYLITWSEKLGLPDFVTERGAYIYKKALERGLIRGRATDQMAAASLYAACRDTQTPRTLKDLKQACNVKKKALARYYRVLLKEMDITMPVPEAKKCVSRIVSNAKLSERTARRAIDILRRAKIPEINAGKDPMAWAAAAVYTASKIEKEEETQKDIALAAGITEVTVRNRFKNLEPYGEKSRQEGPPVASKKHAKEITAHADKSVPEVKDAVHDEAVQATSDDVQMMLRDASKRRVAATASAVQMSMEVEDSAMGLLDSVDFEKLPPESDAMQVAMAASYAAALGRDADTARKIVERAGMEGRELLQLLVKTRRRDEGMLQQMGAAALGNVEINTRNIIAAGNMAREKEKAMKETA